MPADFMGRLATRCARTALAWAAMLLPAAAGRLVLQASDAAGQPLAGAEIVQAHR